VLAALAGVSAGDYQTSAVMRTNLQLDVQVYNACPAAIAADDWFAAHRIGDRSNRRDDVLSFKAAETRASCAKLSAQGCAAVHCP
jgi:hypothetical protein